MKKKKQIWALSNKKENGKYLSQLQAFSLDSGKEQDSYKMTDTVQHLFNDLVIVNEKIYITDTYFSAVYAYDMKERKLQLMKKHPHLTYPNGICTDGKGSLYIATYEHGIVKMDLQSNETTILTGFTQPGISRGLDGIVYYRSRLIGVYNLGTPDVQRVVEYHLSVDGNAVTGERDIDKGNRLFQEPTTLALHKRNLYVIANSHLDQFNKNKASTSGIEDKLSAPVIIKYRLKR